MNDRDYQLPWKRGIGKDCHKIWDANGRLVCTMESCADSTFLVETMNKNTQLEACDLCDRPAEYRQCQRCMNDKLIGSHTDEEYEALQKQKDALFRGISSVRNVVKEALEGGPLFKLDALWLWRVVDGTYKAGGGKDD